MIMLVFVVCFVTVSVCTTTVLCSEKRMRHRYEMAKLKAAQERFILDDRSGCASRCDLQLLNDGEDQ